MLFRRRLRISTIVIAVCCSFLPPGPPVMAAPAEAAMGLHAAVRSLQAYGVVDNETEAELRLGEPITRAEFAKVLGAALREQKMADASRSIPAFADTAGHWANGWIAVARGRGIFLGRGDGFYPEAQVTYAEVMTALLRLTGRSEEAARGWPWGAVSTAVGLGIVPDELDMSRANQSASRGDVFQMTAITIGRVPIQGTGKTLLQTVADQTPPGLSLTGFPSQSDRSQVTVSGIAADAMTVIVKGKLAEVLPNGSFSVQISLEPGENPVPVLAMDGAGNRAEAEAKIVYQKLSRIEVQPVIIETAVGALFSATVLRFDEAERPAATQAISWSYDPAAITRDAKTGQFKALKSGEYTLKAMLDDFEATARVVVAGPPAALDIQVDRSTLPAGGMPVPVHVRVLDDAGRLNTAGSLSLNLVTTPDNVVTLDSKTLKTVNGKAIAYLVPGVNPGACGLQVVATGATPMKSAVVPISVEPRRLAAIRLQATPANLSPRTGIEVAIVATAVDQAGSPIAVTDDMVVSLRTPMEGGVRLTRSTATIKKGTASSDFGGENGAGESTGRIGISQISGAAANLQVQAATVSTQPSEPLASLEVRVLQEAALADDLNAVMVAVSRMGAAGAVVSWDSTPVVLFAPSTAVSISLINDSGGVATFAVRSSTAGRFALTAGVPGRPELNTDPVSVGFVRPIVSVGAKPTLRTDIRSVAPGGSVSVSVAIQGTGGAAPNPGPALVYDLAATGGAMLSQTRVTIPTGATATEPVTLNVPTSATGAITVSAVLVGGKALPTTQLSVTSQGTKPTQNYPGFYLVTAGPGTTRSALSGEEARFVVRALSNNQQLNGTYAFDLKIRLNGKLLDKAPGNLEVSLGNRPAFGLTARTTGGQAEIWVRYNGTGSLEIEPVPRNAASQAYDQYGSVGVGDSTIGYKVVKDQVKYVAGELDHLGVTVDPNLGDVSQGVIKASRGRTAIVRLSPVDIYGNPAGTACIATLKRRDEGSDDGLTIRVNSGNLTENSTAVGTAGYAEFTVAANTDKVSSSTWVPTAVCGATTLSAPDLTVSTTTATVVAGSIEMMGGDVSGSNLLNKSDTVLKLRVRRLPSLPGPVQVLVYNGAEFIGGFGPIDPSSQDQTARTVSIPKNRLGAISRTLSLQVRLNTGAEVSDLSVPMSIYLDMSP